MIVRLLVVAAFGMSIALQLGAANAEDVRSCEGTPTLRDVAYECQTPGTHTTGEPTGRSGAPVQLVPTCGLGGLATCQTNQICFSDDVEGQLYDLVRAGEVIGQTCITDSDDDQPTITPALVEREFRRLAWPDSALSVQPRGGRVLVNFPTNVFTTNTATSRREVTLLGQRVTIEARPAIYHWRFGDGTERATSSPGSPYPGLDVTHEYRDLGPARARVDTEYSGRYRVADGPWIQIAGTATIAGPAVGLTVIEARPKLTGRYAPGA